MSRRADREQEIAKKLDALTLAGVDTPPACDGDDMFIAERVDLIPTDMQRMRIVCARCHLFDLCDDYARNAKPDAGFWAGTLRERRGGDTHARERRAHRTGRALLTRPGRVSSATSAPEEFSSTDNRTRKDTP